MGTKRKAVGILWDVDEGEEDVIEALPKEIVIPDGMDDEDISDFITDMTGFCHRGFAVE